MMLSFFRQLWRSPVTRILASFCILFFLLANLPLSDLWHTLRQISPLLWAAVVTAFIGGHLLGVVKWRLFISIQRYNLPFDIAFRCYFAGLFANLFLPSVAGGDVVRAGLAIRYNGEKGPVIFGSVLDRFLDINSLGILILIGAFYSPASLTAEGQEILITLSVLVLVFILAFLLLLILPLPRFVPKSFTQLIHRIQEILIQLAKNPQRALLGFAFAIFIQGGFVYLNAVLGAKCNIDLPIHVWLLAWPLAKLTAMLPISLGGIGVREVALAAILSRFGVPFSNSVGLGLVWESVLIVGGCIGGIFYLLSSRDLRATRLPSF